MADSSSSTTQSYSSSPPALGSSSVLSPSPASCFTWLDTRLVHLGRTLRFAASASQQRPYTVCTVQQAFASIPLELDPRSWCGHLPLMPYWVNANACFNIPPRNTKPNVFVCSAQNFMRSYAKSGRAAQALARLACVHYKPWLACSRPSCHCSCNSTPTPARKPTSAGVSQMSWLPMPSAETSSHSSNSVSMPLSFIPSFKGVLLCNTVNIFSKDHASLSGSTRAQVTALSLELPCTLCRASREPSKLTWKSVRLTSACCS